MITFFSQTTRNIPLSRENGEDNCVLLADQEKNEEKRCGCPRIKSNNLYFDF